MAFPVVESRSTSSESPNTTSHTVTLPSGVASGDLLIAWFACDDNPSITWSSGTNDGFTEFAVIGPAAVKISVAYRQANGSDVAPTVTTGASEQSAHSVLRISGAEDPATQVPQASSGASGSNDNPDASTLSPTGGAKDYLWITGGAHDGSQEMTVAVSSPAFTDINTTNSGGGAGVGVGTCERDDNTDTIDPGTYTISANDQWVAFIVAVHPANGVVSDTDLLDGKVRVFQTDTDLLDGRVQVVNVDTDILDGKVFVFTTDTDLLDGKIRVFQTDTDLLDGRVQVVNVDTDLLDGKVFVFATDTDLLDGKVRVFQIDTDLLDGRVQVVNVDTDLLDGKVFVFATDTDLLDGRVQVVNVDTDLLDGKVVVMNIDTDLLDGKVIVFATDTDLLDGKVIITSAIVWDEKSIPSASFTEKVITPL